MAIHDPRNGSWAQKRRVGYWCAWWNTKSRGHLSGDETFFYFARSLSEISDRDEGGLV